MSPSVSVCGCSQHCHPNFMMHSGTRMYPVGIGAHRFLVYHRSWAVCTHTAPWCKDTRTPVVFGVCLHIHPHVWCVKGQACAYLWGDKGAGTQCSGTSPLDIGNSHTWSWSIGDSHPSWKDLHPIFPPSFEGGEATVSGLSLRSSPWSRLNASALQTAFWTRKGESCGERVLWNFMCVGYVFLKKFQINFDICLDHKSKPVNYRQAVFLSLLGKHWLLQNLNIWPVTSHST